MSKTFLVILSIWCSISAVAQKPDFSGHWILEKEKSKMNERTAAEILSQDIHTVQTDSGISVSVRTEQAGGDGKMNIGGGEKLYTFSGKETVTSSKIPLGMMEVFCSGVLLPEKLQLTTRYRIAGGPNGEINTNAHETWTLSAGGTVLTIQREVTTPSGIAQSELIYKKG